MGDKQEIARLRQQVVELEQKLAVKPSSRDEEDTEGWELRLGYDRELSVEQAFDWSFARQAPIGCITTMTIGTAPLVADLRVVDPTLLGGGLSAAGSTGGTLPLFNAVGPLRRISWELGETDPITFEARISAQSKEALLELRYSARPVIDVTVGWVIYEFDEMRQKYFVAFSSSQTGQGGTPARGQLKKDGRNLDLRIGSGPETDIMVPRNFGVRFSLQPKDALVQTLYLAAGALRRSQKSWGRARSL